MAIVNMDSVLVNDHALRCRSSGTDDHVIAAHVERLGSERVERDKMLIIALCARKAIEKRRLNLASLHHLGEILLGFHQRKEIGLRVHLRHHINDALSSAAHDKPWMYDRDSHRRRIHETTAVAIE